MVKRTPTINDIRITQKVCDQLVDSFYNPINTAMTKSIPKTRTRVIDNNNPWWTQELQQQRKKLNKLYKNELKQKHPHLTEQYNAYRNQYKKNLETARRKSWEDYKEKIGSLVA